MFFLGSLLSSCTFPSFFLPEQEHSSSGMGRGIALDPGDFVSLPPDGSLVEAGSIPLGHFASLLSA